MHVFSLGRERDQYRWPHRIVSPVPEIRSDGLPFHVFDLGTELVRHDLYEQSRAAFLITVVCKLRNRGFQLSSRLSVFLSV